MTTVADLIEATFDHLYQEHRPSLTTLTVAALSGDATITVASTDNFGPGTFLAIGDELLYVTATNSTTGVCNVLRGQRATTAAAASIGAVVEINPKFGRYRVRRALQDEIRSWPSDVYRVASVNLDTASGTSGYDLTGVGTFLDILDVQIGPRSSVPDVAVVRANYEVLRNADTAIYTSGTGIVLTGLIPSEARDLRVVYSAPFVTTSMVDAVDAEATIGLAASMLDIPPLGAAARLMTGREVKRTFGEGQPESRRAEEVPPGMSSGTATYLRREATRRLGEEAVRLRSIYQIRRL
jgi:hypothetical protein